MSRRTDRIIASSLYGFGIGSGGMWLMMKTGANHSLLGVVLIGILFAVVLIGMLYVVWEAR